MIEYTVILLSVLAIMGAMGTIIRRSSQGWTRLVADQIGVQNMADQQFNDAQQAHLDSSYSLSRADVSKTTLDVAGIQNYIFDDVTSGISNQVTNLGVQPNPR